MRRLFAPVISLLLLLLVTGCSSISVSHSFDPEAEFSTLKSFDWMANPDAKPENALTVKNIQHSLKTQLAAKGITEQQGSPDFLIFIHGGRQKKIDVQQLGYAYADRAYYNRPSRWGYPNWYAGVPVRMDYRTSTYEYDIGTLILDFINPANKELIWRGTATAVVDDPVSQKRIDQAITKMLEGFPPSE
jgi:hypothetical protein